MKIAIEVQRLFRRKKHGMEIVALEILRELQQKNTGHDYTIFVKDDVDRACLKPGSNLEIKVPSNNVFPIWEQLDLPTQMKKADYDILHCTSNTAPLNSRVPMIVTIHDLIYMESLNFKGSFYQNFGNIYRRLVVPRIARKAAMVLTVSEYEKEVIVKRLGLDPDKVRVVYNGVNQQFKPITDQKVLEEFRARYRLPKKFLLHFANTAPKKNTIGVLEAFAKYVASVTDPLPLVLTDCSRTHIMDLLKQINASDVFEKIHILDYVPFASIPCLYNLATVFLYPSHRESFGMPLIEAMACGVPVITSNTSALPEIAGGAACMVDPTNAQEMCEQIIALLSSPALYNDRRIKGFENAKRFSWKNAADTTVAIYNEVLASASKSSVYGYKSSMVMDGKLQSLAFNSSKIQ